MNKDLLAPCGLYCGVCGILIADRENNEKLKEKLALAYGVTPEQITCQGCMSDDQFVYCQACNIRDCITTRKYTGCHQCDEFPCDLINDFPVPVGKKVMLRAIPTRKELGDEKWAEAEEKRYTCPHCGNSLFRGARKCRSCNELVDLD